MFNNDFSSLYLLITVTVLMNTNQNRKKKIQVMANESPFSLIEKIITFAL